LGSNFFGVWSIFLCYHPCNYCAIYHTCNIRPWVKVLTSRVACTNPVKTSVKSRGELGRSKIGGRHAKAQLMTTNQSWVTFHLFISLPPSIQLPKRILNWSTHLPDTHGLTIVSSRHLNLTLKQDLAFFIKALTNLKRNGEMIVL